jgi:peroxiredoxin Q/BCP
MNTESKSRWSLGLTLLAALAMGCSHHSATAPEAAAPVVAVPPPPPAPAVGDVMAVTNIPSVGAPAPDFTLPSNTGKPISLSDFSGKKIVVLYFYPKAGTPGCTKEACAFRDSLASYDKDDLQVIGISPDPVPAITDFTTNYHLNFPLVADADHSIAEKYGVWQQRIKADGSVHWGVARTTFVIGRDGKILHVFEKVNPDGHDQQVLEWVKANVDLHAS